MGFLSLVAKLGMDASGFETGLKKAESLASSFGGKFTKAFAAGSIALAVQQAVKEALDQAKELRQMGEQFDMTAEEIQKAGRAARKSGFEFEAFGESVNKLGDARQGAIAGNEELRKTFDHFGVGMNDLLDPTKRNIELLQQMADTIAKIQLTPQQRAELKDILGKQGSKLGPAMQRFSGMQAAPGDLTTLEVESLNSLSKSGGSLWKQIKGVPNKMIGGLASVDWAKTAEGGFKTAILKKPSEQPKAEGGLLTDPLEAKHIEALNLAYQKGNEKLMEKMDIKQKLYYMDNAILNLESQLAEATGEQARKLKEQIELKRMDRANAALGGGAQSLGVLAGYSAPHLNPMQQIGAFSGVDPIVAAQGRAIDRLTRLIEISQRIEANTKPTTKSTGIVY